MQHPLVSIVITCYNYEKYVASAINSALSQTYQNIEVVVVDDGSSDGSSEIIAGYADKIRPIFQRNQGVAEACNAGFAFSRGDIVLFLDADDLLLPSAIREVVSSWIPGAIKVQYCLKIIDRDGRYSGATFPNFPKRYGPAELRREFLRTGNYLWPMTSGNAYARTFLEKLLPLPVDMFQDGAINTVAPLFGDIATIARPLGCYRIHGSNQWAFSAEVPSRFREHIRRKQKEMEFLRRHADARGIVLPSGNLLDMSLTHVEYRLCALKLENAAGQHNVDSVFRLCLLAIRLAISSRASFGHRVCEASWSIALAVSQGRVARKLIDFRYNPSSRPESFNGALNSLRVLKRVLSRREPSRPDR